MPRRVQVTVIDSRDSHRVIGHSLVVEDESQDDDVRTFYRSKYPGCKVEVHEVLPPSAINTRPDPWYYDAEYNQWVNRETSEVCPGFTRPTKELPPRDQSGKFTR